VNVEDRYDADFEMTEDRREIMRLRVELERLTPIERRALDLIAAQDELAASGTHLDERALGVRRAIFRTLGTDYRPPVR